MIKKLHLSLLMLLIGVWAMASETSVKNADGVEIWYDFDSSAKTASVTYKGKSQYTYYAEYIGNVFIPSKVTYEGEEYSVTSIGKYAFYYCRFLTSITLPEGVTEIGHDSFSGCISLTSIDVALDNNSYTSINGVLFSKDKTILIKYPEGKKDVTSYAIPESVTSIEESAFSRCNSLTSITISENVTEIGKRAFSDCISLTNIDVASNNNIYTSIDGVLFSTDKTILIKYPEGKKDVTSYDISEDVTEIGGYAFEGCSTLTGITLPEGVTTIGSYAFYDCSSLTSITLPEGVTEIGEWAFRDCSSLTSITIPEGVTKIGEYAFYGCGSLTSITLPENVTEIGQRAFSGCSSLTSIDAALDNNSYTSIDGVLFSKDQTILIKYPECKKDVTSYAIPESVTEIRERAFSGCSSLTSITIPESVTEIGEWAFVHCSSLTSITLPESVTEIAKGVFSRCSSLTSITLPESVKSIGESAVYLCSSLTSITSMNVTPPSIYGGSTFNKVDKSIPVYVPKQSVEAYKSAEYWKDFTNIQVYR